MNTAIDLIEDIQVELNNGNNGNIDEDQDIQMDFADGNDVENNGVAPLLSNLSRLFGNQGLDVSEERERESMMFIEIKGLSGLQPSGKQKLQQGLGGCKSIVI